MRILSIEIESFGRLQNFSLELDEGITLVEGENESGKSTILAFLRFAFYGFPRKNATDGDEREKRISWYTHTASGKLTLEWEGGRYRITRRVVARSLGGRDTLSEELCVVELASGREVELSGKTPGEYFLGMPFELYDGSLCLVQSGAHRVSGEGTSRALGDLFDHGDTVFSPESAMEKLQDARRELQHAKGRGGRIAELEDELVQIEEALSASVSEQALLESVRADVERYRGQIADKRRELARISDVLEQTEIDRSLSLLADLRQAAAEETRSRARLEEIGRAGAERLPDKETLGHLAATADELAVMMREAEALERERDGLAAVSHNEQMLRGAMYLERLGPKADALPRRVTGCAKRGKALLAVAILLLLCGGAFAAACYLRSFGDPWLWWATGAVGGLSLVFFGFGVRARRRYRRILRALGAPTGRMLRTYLEQCRREAEAYRGRALRSEEVNGRLTECRRGIAANQALLRQMMTSLGEEGYEPTPDGVRGFLYEVARRRSEIQRDLSEATVAYERAAGIRIALERRAEGLDESALQARRQGAISVGGDTAELRGRQAFLEEALAGLVQKQDAALREESAQMAVARDPLVLGERKRAVAAALAEARMRLAAIRMATEALAEGAEEMRRRVTPRIGRRAAESFAQLTNGDHGALRVGDDLSVTVEENGIPRPLSHFSAGCRDIAHLSLRLALLEAVSGRRLPLLFDEALARLDDTRARRILAALERYAADGGQCILFTCHKRESEMLSPLALRVKL